MLAEFALAAVMVLWTVLFHGLGLFALSRLLRLEVQEERSENLNPASLRSLASTFGLVIGLFFLHGVEIWAYALVFVATDAISGGLREAVYFSTITYAAIGYDDAAMARDWRLVSAIEGVNGVILLGWSTAFFVGLMSRYFRR